MISPLLLLIICIIFVSHYVADFLIQTEWQATNKSHNTDALTAHVASYSVAMGIASVAILPSISHVALFTVATFCTHWITDYFTSKGCAKLHAAGNIRGFFKMLGLDQTIHFLTLFISYYYISNL